MLGTLRSDKVQTQPSRPTGLEKDLVFMEVFQERQAADNEKIGETKPNRWFSE